MAFSEEIKQRAIELYSGRSAREVERLLLRQFPNDELPNERTIRRWKVQGVSYAIAYGEHKEQLEDAVRILLDDVADGLDEDDLVGILDYNSEAVCQKYTEWFFYCCFLSHLINDFPDEYKNKNYWEFLHKQPLQLVEVIKMVAIRNAFKGTCPVCKDW